MKIIQFVILTSILLTLFVSRNYSSLRIRIYVKFVFTISLIGFVFLAMFPHITTYLAHFLGVGRGSDLVFYVSTCGLIGLSGILIAKFREIEISNAKFVRNLAISEWDSKQSS